MPLKKRIRGENSSEGYAPCCQPFTCAVATSAHDGYIGMNSKRECYLWIGHFGLIETLLQAGFNRRPIKASVPG